MSFLNTSLNECLRLVGLTLMFVSSNTLMLINPSLCTRFCLFSFSFALVFCYRFC